MKRKSTSFEIIGRDFITTCEEVSSHSMIERMVMSDRNRAHAVFVRMCGEYKTVTLNEYDVWTDGNSKEVSTITVTTPNSCYESREET